MPLWTLLMEPRLHVWKNGDLVKCGKKHKIQNEGEEPNQTDS